MFWQGDGSLPGGDRRRLLPRSPSRCGGAPARGLGGGGGEASAQVRGKAPCHIPRFDCVSEHLFRTALVHLHNPQLKCRADGSVVREENTMRTVRTWEQCDTVDIRARRG